MIEAQKRNLGNQEEQNECKVLSVDEQLLSQHFELCRQGQELKNKIKAEKGRLKVAFEQLQQQSDDDEEQQQLESQLEEDKETLKHISLQLAAHNKRLALLQRKLDDMPLQGELIQYRKRFVELYNQGEN